MERGEARGQHVVRDQRKYLHENVRLNVSIYSSTFIFCKIKVDQVTEAHAQV